MNELEEKLYFFNNQLKEVKLKITFLKRSLFESFNIKFDIEHNNFTCILGYKDKHNINLSIHDAFKTHFLTDTKIKLVDIDINKKDEVKITPHFSDLLDNETIIKYKYLLDCFLDVKNINFSFDDFHTQTCAIIKEKKQINKNIKEVKKQIEIKKSESIRDKIEAIYIPVNECEVDKLYNRLIDKNDSLNDIKIIVSELHGESRSIIFLEYRILVSKEERLSITQEDVGRNRKKSISKLNLKKLLSQQFYFEEKLVTNLKQIGKEILKSNPSSFDFMYSRYHCNLDDLYNFFKTHINANNF